MKALILPRRLRKIWQAGLSLREGARRRHQKVYPNQREGQGATDRVERFSYLQSVQKLVETSLAEWHHADEPNRQIHGRELRWQLQGARLMREQRLQHHATWPKLPGSL